MMCTQSERRMQRPRARSVRSWKGCPHDTGHDFDFDLFRRVWDRLRDASVAVPETETTPSNRRVLWPSELPAGRRLESPTCILKIVQLPGSVAHSFRLCASARGA